MKSLKEIRNIRGMSQKELAKRIESNQPYIARIEKEIPDGLNISTVKKLSKELGCQAIITHSKIFFQELT